MDDARPIFVSSAATVLRVPDVAPTSVESRRLRSTLHTVVWLMPRAEAKR